MTAQSEPSPSSPPFDPARPRAYLAPMAVRPILILPDPALMSRSKPVAKVTDAVRALADDMLATMYDAPGIGLAAIQVGVAQRVVVIDLARKEDTPSPMVLVNPRILAASEEGSVYEEGCLSIPD